MPEPAIRPGTLTCRYRRLETPCLRCTSPPRPVPLPIAMLALVVAVLAALRSTLRCRLELTAEILALRHQLVVLRRQAPKRLRLLHTDRLFWVMLSRIWTGWRQAVQIVTPDTVVAWHRRGFALYWRWRSRPRGTGRPPVAKDIRDLIRRMQTANPLWGAPRIHAELQKLGIDIAETTVAKYIRRWPTNPPSQNWRTFLSNHASQLASMDFFTVPTATFRVLFVLVILSHDRRRIVHFKVTAHPTAEWTAQQMREAWPYDEAPAFLTRDRDDIYGWTVRNTLQAMGIQEVVTAPHSPWQKGYASHCTSTDAWGTTAGRRRGSESLHPCILSGRAGPGSSYRDSCLSL